MIAVGAGLDIEGAGTRARLYSGSALAGHGMHVMALAAGLAFCLVGSRNPAAAGYICLAGNGVDNTVYGFGTAAGGDANFSCGLGSSTSGADGVDRATNLALGSFAGAQGDASANIALGSSTVSGNNSANIVIGQSSTASGNASLNMAIGTAHADGNNAYNMAFGLNSQSSGDYGVNVSLGVAAQAQGSGTNVVSSGNIAIGNLSDAHTFGAEPTANVAIGQNATAFSNNSGFSSVAIGKGAFAGGQPGPTFDPANNGSTAIGANAQAGAGGTGQALSTAIGFQASANTAFGLALGANATASAGSGIAIGVGSEASGIQSVALGGPDIFGGTATRASGIGSTALGQAAQATADGSVALGQGATAGFANSVAIGQGVSTARADQVKIGSGGNTYTLSGVASSQSRAAQSGTTYFATSDSAGNLALSDYGPATIADHETRLASLDGRVGSLENGFASLSNDITENRTEARQGIAAAIAMTTAPMPSSAGRTSWAANVGFFKGETAFGASMAHRLDLFDEPFALTAGYAYGGGSSHAFRVGLAGEF